MDNSKQKVVIWGHKLEKGHTHSFVHSAFHTAFRYLGYDVCWLDNDDSFEPSLVQGAIFLTEGQVDSKIPIHKNSKYILHNCDLTKYQEVLPNCLNMQVYTKDCLKPERQVTLIEPYVYYQSKAVQDAVQVGVDNRTLYMPWATNLLPLQFPEMTIEHLQFVRDRSHTNWVGSVCDGVMGNLNELQEYARRATQENVQIRVVRVPDGMGQQAVVSSCTAPAVQGAWQVEKGYIPCRVFKNISYGRLPGTNNPTIDELFGGLLPFTPGAYDLFPLEVEADNKLTQEKLDEVRTFVVNKHTYLNRIQRLLEVL